jgi:hypothetical protein
MTREEEEDFRLRTNEEVGEEEATENESFIFQKQNVKCQKEIID